MRAAGGIVRRRNADADVRANAARRRQLRQGAGHLRDRPQDLRSRRAEVRLRPARARGAARSAGSLPRASRHRHARGSLAGGPALPRNDRPRREDAGHLRVDPHGGEVRHLGAHSGSHRIGQGSRGSDDPRAEPPRHAQVPGGELRGAARHAVRVGDLRLRERRLHRRARPQAGPPRARQQRHALPRRNRRPLHRRASQAAACPRGAPLRAARRQHRRSR